MKLATFLSPAVFAATALAAFSAIAADVNVRLMHVDQNPDVTTFYNDVARRFEATHPGVKVEIQYLENESYKKKLTTLLQSPDKPNILYSWGGGVLREQVRAGVVEDLTTPMNSGWKDTLMAASVPPYAIDGKVWGVPFQTSQVGFFYNKDLFAKAGVDAASIKTWDDLLGAVKKFQAAGITPIIAGGGDKWPLHFYWSHLAIRIGGKPAFDAALRNEGKGFASETFVKAGEMFKQLADLKPFQPGYLGATFPQSSGQFGDGKGAMVLMLNGMLGSMKANSADKAGIPDDKLGWMPFPTVAGGKGDPSDTLGGMNGWLVTKGSPPATVEFLRFFMDASNQKIAAEKGLYIPVVNGTQESIKRPVLRQLAENVSKSKYHQIYYDQMLGPSVGAVVNDVSADLAAGRTTPADAANAVQQAWKLAN
ncbi:extracellular solute-binding protein [Variovorax sp. dw_954]|uniref:ABC transporter substrate-binding protein n=1 Tax=Variovorax sp. dw_954 TaxID=2720078 RepID=UPI001BD253D2